MYRATLTRNSEDQCYAIFEKGQRIEQEFAEYFTGKTPGLAVGVKSSSPPSLAAVMEGDSLAMIYERVKNVIHEQSGNYIWVPSTDSF